MILKKADIVNSISNHMGFTKRQSVETVATLLEIMKKNRCQKASAKDTQKTICCRYPPWSYQKEQKGHQGRNIKRKKRLPGAKIIQCTVHIEETGEG